MSKLWKRKVELVAGGKSFSGDDFEIDFSIPFTTDEDPDSSEITIYNLTESTIEAIESQADIMLNAGYEGDVGTILTGTLEKPETSWEGVDKVTKLFIGDGSKEWREKKIKKTYQKGVTASFILNDLAGQFGLEIGDVEINKDKTYKRGRTFTDTLSSCIKQVAKDTETKMYIQGKKIFMRPPDKGDPTGFLLNADTGLIDSPEKTEEENDKKEKVISYTVKCLLNHRLAPDSIIQVESMSVNGTFRVVKGKHEGDFITEVKVVPA